MTPSQLADAAAQLLLLNYGERYRPALSVAVLPGQSASTALVHPESILQNTHGCTASFRAQKVSAANWLLEPSLVKLSISQKPLEAGVLLLRVL